VSHVLDQLPELVAGFLSSDRVADVEAHLGGCAACAAERSAMEEAFHGVPAELVPMSPPSSLRSAVLAAASADPFSPFVDRLAVLFDVAVGTARAYLARLETPDGWVDLLPGITYLDLEGGPAAAGGKVGLVRMDKGARFPLHRHVGVERVLILRGGLRDAAGGRVWAGEVAEMADGTEHWFEALGDDGLVYAVVVADVEILGPAPLD